MNTKEREGVSFGDIQRDGRLARSHYLVPGMAMDAFKSSGFYPQDSFAQASERRNTFQGSPKLLSAHLRPRCWVPTTGKRPFEASSFLECFLEIFLGA